MRYLRLLAVCCLILLGACRPTKNIGGYFEGGLWLNGMSFSDTSPTAGDEVTATINFQGVSGPFTFTFIFGDCVTPPNRVVTVPSGKTSASLTFTLDPFTNAEDADGKDCTVSVTGSDGSGIVGGPVTGTFHVNPIPNLPPTISAVFDPADCSVTVTVDDPEGDDVTISFTAPAAIAQPESYVINGGHGSIEIPLTPSDILAGGSGELTIHASDAAGNEAQATVNVNCLGLGPFIPDTLYAIPLKTTTTVLEPVTIVVLSSDPANPFQYMTGVRVVTTGAAGDFDYVNGSFNVGIPGGAADDVDGIWAAMGINDGDFLLAPDSFYQVVDAGGGLVGLDFNVTPLGGSDLTGTESGALFNFGAVFNTPGTYTLGFQQTNVVNRTYYQDGNQAPDYFWSDISNNHAGVPNSVTVL